MNILQVRLSTHAHRASQIEFVKLVTADLPTIAAAISKIEAIESPILRHKVDDVIGGRIFAVIAALPALTEESRDAFMKARKRLKSLIDHMDRSITSQAVYEIIHFASQPQLDAIRDIITSGYPIDSRDDDGYSALDHLIMMNASAWPAIKHLVALGARIKPALIEEVKDPDLGARLHELLAVQEANDLKRAVEREVALKGGVRPRISRSAL